MSNSCCSGLCPICKIVRAARRMKESTRWSLHEQGFWDSEKWTRHCICWLIFTITRSYLDFAQWSRLWWWRCEQRLYLVSWSYELGFKWNYQVLIPGFLRKFVLQFCAEDFVQICLLRGQLLTICIPCGFVGYRQCEICGEIAQNVQLLEPMDDSSTDNPGTTVTVVTVHRPPTACWQNRPIRNFLLVFLVAAFLIPWLFRFAYYQWLPFTDKNKLQLSSRHISSISLHHPRRVYSYM